MKQFFPKAGYKTETIQLKKNRKPDSLDLALALDPYLCNLAVQSNLGNSE